MSPVKPARSTFATPTIALPPASPEAPGLDDLEVAGRQSETLRYGGELRRRLPAGAVGIVQQGAAAGVVDDAVAGIVGGGTDEEGVDRQRSDSAGLGEYQTGERDPVGSCREIGDGR